MNLLDWLKNTNNYPKFFWKSKATKKCTATVGKKEQLSSAQNCVFSFDLKRDHIWSAEHEKEANNCDFSLKNETYAIVNKETIPSFEKWKELVIKAKSLHKVVLARKHTLTFDKKICPYFFMQKIMKKSPYSFLFLYQIDNDHTFLGASPETLFYRLGNTIFTEAVAGTTIRGKTVNEDRLLADLLLKDGKEKQEFSYVSNYLEKWLQENCFDYTKSKLTILKTPWLQHLHVKFRGELKHTIDNFDVIKTLHPTPAVGGIPKKSALSFLKKNEPFDRTFYAAPIGRITEKESEFAVAIRSCMIYKNSISIYSGTGIVKDSDPEKEWEELQNKMHWIMDVINTK